MRGIITNQRGFTFIEIILAIALIGIVAAGLLSGIEFATKTLFASGKYMQKNYTNQGDLEDFVGKGTTTGTTSSQTLTLTWQSGTVPGFTSTGIQLDEPADSVHLHEIIKAFYPTIPPVSLP